MRSPRRPPPGARAVVSVGALLSLLGLVLTAGGCSSERCVHAGTTYHRGEGYWDGCNSCFCGSHGELTCTHNECVPDAGVPTNHDASKPEGGSEDVATSSPDLPQRDAGPNDDPGNKPDSVAISDRFTTDAVSDAAFDAPPDAASADRPPILDAFSPVDRPCDFAEDYEYGPVGGLVAYTDRSYLSPGNRYRHVRTPVRGDGATLSCEVPVPACSMAYLTTAFYLAPRLANPEVTAALSPSSPPLFGFDERPMDGTVLELKTARGSLLMGSECGTRTPCRAIPQVIRELKSQLLNLDTQQLAMPACQAAGFSH